MKNRVLNAFLLLAIAGTMFASCKKEYPQPPIQDLPIGKVYTIGEILDLEAGTVFDTASVYGIVTADEVSGNLYKMVFIQDRATGAAIELKLDAVSGVRIGDSIRLYLKDVTYDMYHNLPQLSGFGPDGHIVILANQRPITPALTTIADIKAGQHMCGLVRLENVKFTQEGTFAETSESGNRYLVDATSPNNDDNFVVRTSNYANFAYDSLPQGIGNLVAIASVYNSTWQLFIRSRNEMEFNGGSGGDTPIPTPTVEGDGSRENPYTAKDIIALGIEISDGQNYWVKDFVVGAINANNDYAYEFGTTTMASNIIISSNADASTEGECVPVQLPVGDVRTGVNLVDNPGNYKQAVLLYGTLEKYFQKPSVKNVTYAEINGNAFGTDPDIPPVPVVSIFSESFANGIGGFTIQDVLLPEEGLEYVWTHDSQYTCMKASAYVGQCYATESWLVSPAIDLSSVGTASLSFKQAVNKGTPEGALFVMVSKDYNGDVAAATWTELSLDQWPAGTNWTFIDSSADLTPYVGQTVTLAFKYTSTTSTSATWEVKELLVKE